MKSKLIFLVSLALSFPLIAQADQIEQSVECASGTTVLEYGQNATCQLDSSSDQDKFQFTAAAGDDFYITLSKLGGGSFTKADIYTPSNIKLTRLEVTNSLLFRDERFTATETGMYTINISDSVASAYRIQVDSPRSAIEDTPVKYGEAFQNTISYEYDRDYFAINMSANTSVSVNLTRASALQSPDIRIFGPGNIELLSGELDGSLTSKNFELDVYQSGTYIIEIVDKLEGIYEISAQCVSGTCPEGGEAQPSLDYLAGVEYCRTNPIECGVAMPSVGADLSISLPLATFGDSPVEKLWAELRYKGDLTWELDDFSFVE